MRDGGGGAWWEREAPEAVDDRLQLLLRGGDGGGSGRPAGPRGRAGWYTLLLLPGPGGAGGDGGATGVRQPWVGRYRHGWALFDGAPAGSSGGSFEAARPLAAAAAAGAAAWLRAAACGAAAALPLSSAGAAVLSFSLLNADPVARRYGWDFEAFEAQYVAPMVRALRPLAALSVESQVRAKGGGQGRAPARWPLGHLRIHTRETLLHLPALPKP
jgi:hypothetical protein